MSFRQELKASLEKEIQTIKDKMGNGQYVDLPAYNKAVGTISGLRMALDKINEVKE